LAGQVELDIDLKSLATFFLKLSGEASADSAIGAVAASLIDSAQIFEHARQFLGLSDKRAYLDLSYLASRTVHPKKDTSLCGCQPWTLKRHPMEFFLSLLRGSHGKEVQIASAEMIATYLVEHGLYEAAKGFSGMSESLMKLVYTQLIIPKEYQQKAAKRRGHGSEAALATVLVHCGVRIIPENKATNPMGASDPHLNLDTMELSDRQVGVTHAFDMLILDKTRVSVAIQSLIHTSDPGQYGVDKSNETVLIAEKGRSWNRQHASQARLSYGDW
jgi:hypothetical protein